LDQTDKDEALKWVLDKISASRRAKAPSVTKSKEEKQEELFKTKSKEIQLWHAWKSGGMKPKDLDPLLKSLDRLIKSRSSQYKSVEVPHSAIDFEHKKYVVEALKSYDPKKGALSTHLMTRIRHAGRLVQETQNLARLPENIIRKIKKYSVVKSELTDKLGYEPDTDSLYEALQPHGYSKRDVIRLNKELRKGLVMQGYEGSDTGVGGVAPTNVDYVVHAIWPQLTPDERAVHEYLHGLNGKPKLKSGQIAKQLKMDNSKVSKLITSGLKKMEPYL
jgi:DNA-directed RNA polymerase sigma subunit (sigma70/sigma32)